MKSLRIAVGVGSTCTTRYRRWPGKWSCRKCFEWMRVTVWREWLDEGYWLEAHGHDLSRCWFKGVLLRASMIYTSGSMPAALRCPLCDPYTCILNTRDASSLFSAASPFTSFVDDHFFPICYDEVALRADGRTVLFISGQVRERMPSDMSTHTHPQRTKMWVHRVSKATDLCVSTTCIHSPGFCGSPEASTPRKSQRMGQKRDVGTRRREAYIMIIHTTFTSQYLLLRALQTWHPKTISRNWCPISVAGTLSPLKRMKDGLDSRPCAVL